MMQAIHLTKIRKLHFFLSSGLGGTFYFKNVFSQMRNLYISHNKVFFKMIFSLSPRFKYIAKILA